MGANTNIINGMQCTVERRGEGRGGR